VRVVGSNPRRVGGLDDGLDEPTAWTEASADAAALAESEKRFRLAMDRSAVAMNLNGPDGRFLQVNDAMVRLFGRSRAELLASTWQELTHPEDLAADEALGAELMAGGRDSYRMTKRYVRPDGSIIWGDLTVSCVRAADGSVEYAIAQIVDVTDQVAFAAELEQSERLLASIMENAPVATGVTTADGAFVRVSAEMGAFFGRSIEEILAMRWQDLTDDEDVIEEQVLIAELMAGARDSYRLLKEFTLPDRTRRWGLLSVTCLRAPDRSVEYLIGQIVDVTSQQQALATLEGTLASMLDPHVLLAPVLDDTGGVVDAVYERANDAACAYLGLEYADVLGTRLCTRFAGEAVEQLLSWCQDAIREGLVSRDDVTLVSALSGEPRWFDVRAVLVDGKVSFTWRDVSDRHRAAEEVARREYRYRMLADNATDVIVQTGPDSAVVWVSPSVTEVLGWRIDEVVGRRLSDLMHPADLAAIRGLQQEIFAAGGTEGRMNARFRTSAGGWRWMSDHGRALLDDEGRLVGGIDSLRDIQAEQDARLAVEQRERELRGVVDTLLDPWVLLEAVRDDAGRIVDLEYVDANDAACAFNHLTREQLLGLRLLDLLPEHGPSGIFDRYVHVIESGQSLLDDDAPFTDQTDGTERRFDNRAVKVGDGISLTWRDVTDRYRARQLLHEQADHDLLTGVANRRQLERRMAEVLAREPRRGERIAVLYCDLDHFKEVNDAYGHAVGDDVLAAVAESLRAAVREGDIVSRLGGDEFVIVLDGVRDSADAERVAAKVRDAVAVPAAADGVSVTPRLSVGIAVGQAGDDPADLLARADAALYRAKDSGRDRAVLEAVLGD
jgi:diguanylate cyclase (GGDEF)-like protein/PAS domain S-box-containing protein